MSNKPNDSTIHSKMEVLIEELVDTEIPIKELSLIHI